MKRVALAGLLMAAIVGFSGTAEAGRVRVRGARTKSGSYRKPHYRTTPNRTKRDNWSTKGNWNPTTGKSGTKAPYR